MYSKCPGQDTRNLRVEIHKCPNCGAEVEISQTRLESNVRNAARWYLKKKCLPVLSGVLQRVNASVKSGGNNNGECWRQTERIKEESARSIWTDSFPPPLLHPHSNILNPIYSSCCNINHKIPTFQYLKCSWLNIETLIADSCYKLV